MGEDKEGTIVRRGDRRPKKRVERKGRKGRERGEY